MKWAAAPSTASDSAKQLASFSMRTARARCAAMSRSIGLPFSAVLFEFFKRPVLVDSAPGVAITL